MKCCVENCSDKVVYRSPADYCTKHYIRLKRHGDPLYERKFKKEQKCIVEGCIRKQYAKGYCNTHRVKLNRTGTLEYLVNLDGKSKERDRTRTAQWKKDNKKYYNAYLAARKARVKQATPPWADLDAIQKFYENRPEGYHVDHIIPLLGKNISGLHVLENLRYLPEEENLKKSNKF